MEDIELVEKAKTNEAAFEKLLQKYKALVLSIARRYFIVGGDIDDVMQEGMIGLYKAIMCFCAKKHASFITFATICIKRQIQSAIRKANSKKNMFFMALFDNDKLNFLDKPSNKENPEKNYISKQNIQHFNDVINKSLSKLEKQVLAKYLNGEKYEKIAEDLNIKKKGVDNALSRIRQKLSVLLDDIKD